MRISSLAPMLVFLMLCGMTEPISAFLLHARAGEAGRCQDVVPLAMRQRAQLDHALRCDGRMPSNSPADPVFPPRDWPAADGSASHEPAGALLRYSLQSLQI